MVESNKQNVSTTSSVSKVTAASKSKPLPNSHLSSKSRSKLTQKQKAKLIVKEAQPTKLFSISTNDVVIALFFTALAALTRFYRIDKPRAVVFDELHFSKFCDRVLTGTWFFDIHPPLGKFILAHGSYLLGYRPDPKFIIEKVGFPYPEHVKFWLMRSVSAFFSVLTIPTAFAISRMLQFSMAASILSTSTVLFDFIGLIEGRLILMDSQLLFFCQLSLLLALILWRTRSGTLARYVLLVGTGLATGAALSIKHTALATPALITLISFLGIHFLSFPLSIMECISATLCGLSLYVSTFYFMLKGVRYSGGNYDQFMPPAFRRRLIGAREYNEDAPPVKFWKIFLYLNYRMVASSANIKRRHNWESKWFHWIVNWRGILFYSLRETTPTEGRSERLKTQIYLLGNPMVISLILFCVISFASGYCLTIRYRHVLKKLIRPSPSFRERFGTGLFLFFGWISNLLPYILVDRAAFLYHYLPGMFYGQLLCGLLIDFLPPRPRVFVTGALIIFMIAALVYWSPWIYGLPLTDGQHAKRRWLPRWN